MLIKCNQIYTENGCESGVLDIKNGIFQGIYPQEKVPNENITFTYDNARILPGIIDIHTHGYKGCNAQSTDKLELKQLCKHLASVGVTSFLPTAGEHLNDEMENLAILSDLIENPCYQGAQMLGIHMEGPFLNPNQRGSFTKEQLLPCNIEKAKQYLEASHNHIRYMSLAPELDPQGELIRFLSEQGVIVAGGHTQATFEEYSQGIAYGLRASTHTGNAMKQMDRRDPGALGCALLSKDIFCEVICDFHHIHPDMLKIMFSIKPNAMEKMIMISDSGQLSGLPPGKYKKYDQVRIIDEDGSIRLEDGTIAGSSNSILYGIKKLENCLAIIMEDIVRLFAQNPAVLLGIDHQKGSISKGKDADFIIIDKDYNVIKTFVEGNCVYSI